MRNGRAGDGVRALLGHAAGRSNVVMLAEAAVTDVEPDRYFGMSYFEGEANSRRRSYS